jgi:hypothetical protein
MEVYRKARKKLRSLLIGFVNIFIVYVIMFSALWAGMIFCPENPVKQEIKYKGYSFIIRGKSEWEAAEGLYIAVYKDDKLVMPLSCFGCVTDNHAVIKMSVSEPIPGIAILTEQTFPHIIYFMFDLKTGKRIPSNIDSPVKPNPEYQATLEKMNSKLPPGSKKYMGSETVPGDLRVKIH